MTNEQVDCDSIRRNIKQREFRQYLVDRGIVDALVRFFMGTMQEGNMPDDGSRLLKDFFGDYHDPRWDDISAVRSSTVALKQENSELEACITAKTAELATANRALLAHRFIKLIGPAKPDATRKEILMKMVGAEGKKVNAPLQALLPDTLSKADLSTFMKSATDEEVALVSGWLDQPPVGEPGKPVFPWPNADPSEALRSFWTRYGALRPPVVPAPAVGSK